MKHTPPHVLLTRRSWRRWSSGTPRHRRHSLAAASFSYTFDVNGLGCHLIAEAAKAMLRLRSGNNFIPHLSSPLRQQHTRAKNKENMDHGHMHDMPPPSSSSPPSSMMNNGSMNGGGGHHHMMMMHMTFFWGKNTEVLFSGWPGTSSGMYALCLIFVFFLAVLTEWLAHSSLLRGPTGDSANRAAGLIQTAVYTLRTGLGYLVMLAVMSFNAGVFLVALAGHAIGFMLFGSQTFRNPSGDQQAKVLLPPSGCAC